jgi:hypothetical protein
MAEETKQAMPRLADRMKRVRKLVRDAGNVPMILRPAAMAEAVHEAVVVMEEMAERLDRIGGGDAKS